MRLIGDNVWFSLIMKFECLRSVNSDVTGHLKARIAIREKLLELDFVQTDLQIKRKIQNLRKKVKDNCATSITGNKGRDPHELHFFNWLAEGDNPAIVKLKDSITTTDATVGRPSSSNSTPAPSPLAFVDLTKAKDHTSHLDRINSTLASSSSKELNFSFCNRLDTLEISPVKKRQSSSPLKRSPKKRQTSPSPKPKDQQRKVQEKTDGKALKELQFDVLKHQLEYYQLRLEKLKKRAGHDASTQTPDDVNSRSDTTDCSEIKAEFEEQPFPDIQEIKINFDLDLEMP